MTRTPKKAKCGSQTLSFCQNKHDTPQCASCLLVTHRTQRLYKYIEQNGKIIKYKLCPHCHQYDIIDNFPVNSNGNRSWCRECTRTYARIRSQANNQTYMIGYKENHKKTFIQMPSLCKTMKWVRQFLEENANAFIEIKRIK